MPLLIVNEFNGFSGDLSKHSCFGEAITIALIPFYDTCSSSVKGLADKLIKYQTNFIERAREEIHITPIILIFLQGYWDLIDTLFITLITSFMCVYGCSNNPIVYITV